MSETKLSPVTTGLRGRCPVCGEGSLFSGFLEFARECQACGENFDSEDAGDGPAVFVIFAAGIFVIPAALAFQLILDAPTWLTLLIWIPILIAFCLALLRPLRGIMFNMQFKHQAAEHRAESRNGPAQENPKDDKE